MANYFVDTGLATGNNDGTTMDDAWQSIETALEYNAFAAGDRIWIRRRSSFSGATSDITINGASDGTAALPIVCQGWPRTTHAIASSDWTNGSTEVTVDDADMDREKHQGRWITGPDSRRYLITRVVDADTIIIDREYVGSTATNQAATISADEDYTEAQAIDDSAWTIKKTDWNGDADDLPVIDFEANAYQLYNSGSRYWQLGNLDLRDGTDANGTVYWGSLMQGCIVGCLFKKTQNTYCLNMGPGLLIDRCIFEGSGSGSSQYASYGSSGGTFRNVAIWGMGDWGLRLSTGRWRMENVNIGVEVANGDIDIYANQDAGSLSLELTARDLKLGGTNGTISSPAPSLQGPASRVENYGKVLGAHGMWAQDYAALAVVAGSGDPYKRTGGADTVLHLPGASMGVTCQGEKWWMRKCMFEHRVWADTSSKSYRYYVQMDSGSLTATEIVLTAEYVDGYDDASEYHKTEAQSDETITARTGADDWSQYVEVTGIQPAVASWVILKLYVQYYDQSSNLYIDPKVVIS